LITTVYFFRDKEITAKMLFIAPICSAKFGNPQSFTFTACIHLQHGVCAEECLELSILISTFGTRIACPVAAVEDHNLCEISRRKVIKWCHLNLMLGVLNITLCWIYLMLHVKQLRSHLFIGKAIPLPAWTGPEGSRRLRLPDFKIIDI
jgi:hypothetical protein